MDINQLTKLAESAQKRNIKCLFQSEPNRAKRLSITSAEMFLDYSKQNISQSELDRALALVKKSALSEQISAMFSGEKINNTESRAVLHALLRMPPEQRPDLPNIDFEEISQTEEQLGQIVQRVHQGKLLSKSGKKFTDVISIGIGGSYYGVKVALSALEVYQTSNLNVHVLANIDADAVLNKINKLDLDTTLVVVISKTFTTQETLLNANIVKQWMLTDQNDESIIQKQWFAVSTNINKVNEFGISTEHTLAMWDWVGGRFSIWSAVGLPLALAIGIDNFNLFKKGAYLMDKHFVETPFENNMPVIMALLGLWNRNALNHPSLAILPYNHSLRALPGYLQQTDMESNGKSVTNDGEEVSWQTAPIVFGQEGTNSQHAFMQLMHQGQDVIPTDFITVLQNNNKGFEQNQKVLVANCFAQSEALMVGKTLEQAKIELKEQGLTEKQVSYLAPHKVMKGNTPSNTLVMNKLTPASLGALLALYEHKIFVQGVFWQINPFDQWGVELGKVLGNQIISAIDGSDDKSLSSSTEQLIEKFNASKES